MPGLSLLGAIERKEDESLWGSSIETSYLIGTNNETTASSSYNRACFVDNASLVGGSVVYFSNSDDNISRRLRLGMETLDGRGPDIATPASRVSAEPIRRFMVFSSGLLSISRTRRPLYADDLAVAATASEVESISR